MRLYLYKYQFEKRYGEYSEGTYGVCTPGARVDEKDADNDDPAVTAVWWCFDDVDRRVGFAAEVRGDFGERAFGVSGG